VDRESKTTQTDYITLIRLTQCLAPTVRQHVAGGWLSDGYQYWYWVLVSVWPNNIGYWVASLVSF